MRYQSEIRLTNRIGGEPDAKFTGRLLFAGRADLLADVACRRQFYGHCISCYGGTENNSHL